ncbi:MAG: esterase FrsA [Sphingopyxis sp.]|nr:esterase FrsA [Sphingopyxis sp.]
MTSSQTKAHAGAYGPEGWLHWPEHSEKSFNFIRVLASAYEGACTVGEAFLVGSRIEPGNDESWYVEWTRMGDVSRTRAEDALGAGHPETARGNFLRAANYYRAAEYFMDHGDPRRLQTFDKVEDSSQNFLRLMKPAGEVLQIPFNDSYLDAYFVRAPDAVAPYPVVICFGGADEYKDELLHEMPRHAFPRGLSLLLVDLPGQGGSLRRRQLHARVETEKPVGACVDYLLSRGDVDSARIALYGASLGGFYAPRAASFEHRLACVVSDGAIWNRLSEEDFLRAFEKNNPDSLNVRQLTWLVGAKDWDETIEKLKNFKLEGVIDKIRCPYLVVHGEQDFLGADIAEDSVNYARSKGVDVTYKLFTPEETGAAHCQMDNPTLGQEYICDWIADKLGLVQT